VIVAYASGATHERALRSLRAGSHRPMDALVEQGQAGTIVQIVLPVGATEDAECGT
jgi:hypothetical protein